MPATLIFVHCDPTFAEQLAEPYRARGWDVGVEDATAEGCLDRIVEAQPLAAAFCLDAPAAEHVVATAHAIVGDERLRRPLMVFLGGEAGVVERAKVAVPYGVFVQPGELGWVLKHLDARM